MVRRKKENLKFKNTKVFGKRNLVFVIFVCFKNPTSLFFWLLVWLLVIIRKFHFDSLIGLYILNPKQIIKCYHYAKC